MTAPARKRAIEPLALVAAPSPEIVKALTLSFRSRLDRYPGHPDVWNQLGMLHAGMSQYAEAAFCFERALAIHPRYLAALENRAWVSIACSDLEVWERFHTGSDGVHLNLGVRHHLRCFATARFESLDRALVLAAMPPQGRSEAAHVLDRLWLLVSLDRLPEARTLVETIVRPDPAIRAAFESVGLTGPSAGPESFGRWASAYGWNPQMAEVSILAARRCQRLGDVRESRLQVDWALSLTLNLTEFWINLANHHEFSGEVGRSVPCLERAIAANPTHRGARLAFARALAARGRPREAIAQFEALRGLAPEFADVRFSLGLMLHDCGDLDQAAEEFSAAVCVNPRYTRAALALARVRFEQGRWGEARAAYERVVAEGLDHSDIRTTLAEVYAKLGEHGLAEESFRRALALNAEDTNVYRVRADWLEAQGRKEEAAADRNRLEALLREGSVEPATLSITTESITTDAEAANVATTRDQAQESAPRKAA